MRRRNDIKIIHHEDYNALHYSSYALVALDRVIKRIYDHLDYSDQELKYVLFELQQETMDVSNLEFGYVINEAKKIQDRLYKGAEIYTEN